MIKSLCPCGAIRSGYVCEKCGRGKKKTPTGKRKRTYRWERLSQSIRSENPLCELCLWHGRVEPSRDVHHLRRRFDYPALEYERDNCLALCKECHLVMDGMDVPGEIRHMVITGPPGSGKTTYARTHMGISDLLFDLDELASALNPAWQRIEGRPVDVAKLLVRWRMDIVDHVRELGRSTWIIVTSDVEASRIARQIGATVHRC